MTNTDRTRRELITIGAFARATGLTPGALRFYSDCSILQPTSTDPTTGYRYYTTEQIEVAVTIRRLRAIGMALDKITRVIAGEGSVIDEHVDHLVDDARRARITAGELHAQLRSERGRNMTTVNGPIFAAAVDQILTATAQHRDHPVLGGVNLEVEADTVTLTATDRFRLSTRSVSAASQPSPEHTGAPGWHAVVDGDDLRSVLETIRRHHRVHLAADGSGLTIGFHDLDDDDLDDDDLVGNHSVGNHSDDGDVALRCRVLPERFPDYRGMLDGLPPVVTRVVAPRGALVRAIEDRQHEFLVLNMREGIVMVGGTSDPAAVEIAATVDGPAVRMAFAMTTLYPSLVSAVGAEVMIDISAPHMPVVIRSADNGDLTTLAMPIDRGAH